MSLLASAGLSSIALRVPNHPLALALLRAVDRPIVAPSANPSGRVSPTTAEHVKRGMGEKVAIILDGGPCTVGVELTVVSFMHGQRDAAAPRRLAARRQLKRFWDMHLKIEADSAQPHAPGQLESHYAPQAHLRLDATAPAQRRNLSGLWRPSHGPYTLSARGDVVEAAANLFRMLHELDGLGVEDIAIAPIPHEGLGEAINDRLRRAAAPRPKT